MDNNLEIQLKYLALLLMTGFAVTCEEIVMKSNHVELESHSKKSICEVCICLQSAQVLNCTDQSLHNFPADDVPSSIRVLDANNNKISVLRSKTHYQNLNILHLKNNKLKDVASEFMLACPNLTELDLSDNDLENLPENLPKSLQKLYLSGNKIVSIVLHEAEGFHKLKELYLANNAISTLDLACCEHKKCKSLNKLQKLDLSGNDLEAIEEYTFKGLSALRALSLARNKLASLDGSSFHGLKNLQFLDLSINHIKTIQNDTFVHLSQLKYLYLKNNNLIAIPHGLPMLDWLDVSYNKIQTVNETLKECVYPIELVNLGHNPFHCDCHMLWLKEWYDRRQYILEYTDAIPPEEYIPTCDTPSYLHGDSWDFLSDDAFRCEDGDKPSHISASFPRHNMVAGAAPPGTGSSEEINSAGSSLTWMTKLNVQLQESTSSSLTVSWDVPDLDGQTKFFILFYNTDQKNPTTSFVQVQLLKAKYTIGNLEPGSVYAVCLLPEMNSVSLSVQPKDCIRESTLPVSERAQHDGLWTLITDSRIGIVTCACLILSMVIVAGGLILAELMIRLMQTKEHKD